MGRPSKLGEEASGLEGPCTTFRKARILAGQRRTGGQAYVTSSPQRGEVALGWGL